VFFSSFKTCFFLFLHPSGKTRFELGFTGKKIQFSPVENQGMQGKGFEYQFNGKKSTFTPVSHFFQNYIEDREKEGVQGFGKNT